MPTGKKIIREFKIIAYKVTKEKLIAALEKLGWKVERRRDDFFAYPYTPKGERISWHILNDRIETTNDYDFSIVCAFYFKDCYLEKQDETLCLRQKNSKSVFILFHNFKKN